MVRQHSLRHNNVGYYASSVFVFVFDNRSFYYKAAQAITLKMAQYSPSEIEGAWNIGVFDAHCHPTDIMDAVGRLESMKANTLTIMATRSQDQELVRQVALKYHLATKFDVNDKNKKHVVPSFGWHPWFAHQIYDDRQRERDIDAKEHYRSVLVPVPDDDDFLAALPTPISLRDYLRSTEERLKEFQYALVGEVGIDRSFRVPYESFRVPDDPESQLRDTSAKTGAHEEGEYTAGSREGRPLSPHRVSLHHQKMILKAQFQLAARLKRSVSVHSVQAHGVVFEVLQELWQGHQKLSKRAQKKQRRDEKHPQDTFQDEDPDIPYPPRVCMHSYSGPVDALKQYLAPTVPADIYFSFSSLINFGSQSPSKTVDVIKAIPNDRILIESDLHCAGDTMDSLLEKILIRVCEVKGWGLEEGAKQLRRNWEQFIFGE